MKCMPITCDGRLVELASCEMEMEEVLVAMIASGLRVLQSVLNTDCLTLAFSTMAYVREGYFNNEIDIFWGEFPHVINEGKVFIE